MIKRTKIRKVRSKPRPGRLKGKDMEWLRKFVFIRDRFRCQHVLRRDESGEPLAICGQEVTWESGHLAHVISRGRGGKDEASNCVCKCAECHIIREHHEGNGGKIVPSKLGGADNDLLSY